MADVNLFLSCVSDEFGDDRDALRRALTRPNVEIKIQEDFQNLGGDTLAMLEAYIESGRDGGLGASVKQRRRPFASPTRACSSAD
jgi:hypothetical protein